MFDVQAVKRANYAEFNTSDEDSTDLYGPSSSKRGRASKNDAIGMFSDFLENLGLDARKVRQKKPYSGTLAVFTCIH